VGNFILILHKQGCECTFSISYCKDNIKCDSASLVYSFLMLILYYLTLCIKYIYLYI
jgi:hypothetical protein